MIPGIDLSHHNALSAAPWHTVTSGFAFVRATFGGTGLDTAATEHLARGLAAGCPALGAYHYLRADSLGEKQARHFLSRVEELEQMTGPLMCAVDVEDMPPPHPPFDRTVYASRLYVFLETMAKADRVCAVYIAPWMAAAMALDQRVGACPLWLAHWVSVPKVPFTWANVGASWTIWQYGVEGPKGAEIDRNRCRLSVADLRAVMGLDRPAATYDTLGPVTVGVRAAEGRGATVEDFVFRDEGPVIGDA